MSHYDGRQPRREFDHWTDERVVKFLDSQGGIDTFCVDDGLYGQIQPDGASFVWMDDDDERVAAVVAYLKKIGAPQFPE